jgi:hypothetical protein
MQASNNPKMTKNFTDVIVTGNPCLSGVIVPGEKTEEILTANDSVPFKKQLVKKNYEFDHPITSILLVQEKIS